MKSKEKREKEKEKEKEKIDKREIEKNTSLVLQAEDFCKNSPFTSTLLQPTLKMIS